MYIYIYKPLGNDQTLQSPPEIEQDLEFQQDGLSPIEMLNLPLHSLWHVCFSMVQRGSAWFN